jgi:glutathione S-transferase
MARHFVKLDDHPSVAEWYERITDRPAFQKSLPQGGGIYDKEFYEPWPVEQGE